MKTTIKFVGKYKVPGVDNYATINDCYNYIKDKRLLGLDIETTRKFQKEKEKKGQVYRGGLDPYLSNVVMLQIGDLNEIYVIDVRDYTKKELEPITTFINWNSTCTFVGVNLKFEGKHLRHNYGIRLNKVWDCMIVEMCLYNGLQRSYSLAGMAFAYLDIKKVEDISLFESEKESTMNDEFIRENEYLLTPFEIANNEQINKMTRMEFVTIGTKKFNATQILYGADDILYPILIMERQLLGRKISNGEVYLPHRLFRLENKFTQVIADMELNGVPFNPEVWLKIAEEQEGVYNERLGILNKYIEQFYPKFVEAENLFNLHRRCMVEWSSSKQVIELFRYLDICPKEFSKSTKKMDWTVGAVALLKTLDNKYKDSYMEQNWQGFEVDESGNFIEDNQRLILAYLLFKRAEQNITTFGREWLKYVHPITKRVHTNFRQILNSGRMASSSPNVQQIPGGVYREAFAVNNEKHSLVFADFSNQEVRTVACLAEEEVMIDFFVNGHPVYGDDMHTYTANNMNKAHDPSAEDFPNAKDKENFTPFHKKKRGEAKVISFGLLYGKEAKGFAEDFGLTPDEAQVFIDNYFSAYPKLKEAMDKWAKHTFKNEYIQIDTLVDRRWFNEDFKVMEETNEEIREFYPEEYFERGKMNSAEKALIKEQLNQEYPEIKQLWRKYFGIRGSIQRKSTNYRIQGCIPASSNVLTDKGWVTIGEFDNGIVWTGENWAPATKVSRGLAPIIKLTLSNGYEYICDNRHKLLVKSDNQLDTEFCHIDNILGKSVIFDTKISKWGVENGSEEDWYWFGRLIGDGWVTKSGAWGIVFNRDEFADKDRFCNWLDTKNLITKTSNKNYKGYSVNFKLKGKKSNPEDANVVEVRLTSKDSHKLLNAWSICIGFSGNKHLPRLVFNLDYNRRLAIFKGWYDADGRKYSSRGGVVINGKRYNRLSCSNTKLQQDFLKLIQTLGMTGRIDTQKTSTDIYIHTEPLDYIVDKIEYLGYEEETFTLTVQDHLHRFSNEGLISKNTSSSETKSALILMREELIKKGVEDVWVIVAVHDEIGLEVINPEREDFAVEFIERNMMNGANLFLNPPIMKAEAVIGKYWVH